VLEWRSVEQNADGDTIDLRKLQTGDLVPKAARMLMETGFVDSVLLRHPIEPAIVRSLELLEVELAPIQGDLPEVSALSTRIVKVLDPKNPLTANLSVLKRAVIRLQVDDAQSEAVAAIMCGVWVIQQAIGGTHGNYEYYPYELSLRSVKSTWKALVERINQALDQAAVDFQLPDELDDVVGARESWFDAAEYWRDWERQSST